MHLSYTHTYKHTHTHTQTHTDTHTHTHTSTRRIVDDEKVNDAARINENEHTHSNVYAERLHYIVEPFPPDERIVFEITVNSRNHCDCRSKLSNTPTLEDVFFYQATLLLMDCGAVPAVS